jgi:trk system potassium uptake protein TrkA
MKILIAGAGDIGFHLAKMLTSDEHAITLIDTNESVLDYAGSHLDILVLKGDATSITTLKNAQIEDADLFIAVTTFESVNMVACILAKQAGAKQTIARVNKGEFTNKEQKAVFKQLGIDKVIFPTRLAAYEIERLLKLTEVTDNFEFEGGKMSVIGVKLDSNSPFVGRTLIELDELYPHIDSRPITILRGQQTILPRSNTLMNLGDNVYFITLAKDREQLLRLIGRTDKKVRKVMILGGASVGYETAVALDDKYSLTIVDKSKEVCKKLVEVLENGLVIEGDPSNMELLKEEGLSGMDAIIAVTPNSETNIIACLMAEHSGVNKTIALVDNTDYTHISQRIGIDTIINKRLIAANNIFRYVKKGKVEAITSLHGVDAEIIEYIIDHESVLTSKPLRQVPFPKNALIAGVIRGEESIIPNGDFQVALGDKVIVLGVTNTLQKLDDLFR